MSSGEEREDEAVVDVNVVDEDRSRFTASLDLQDESKCPLAKE